MKANHEAGEAIENYLDELLSCARLPPRATRRLLAETEDHLLAAAEAAEQSGLTKAEAEREAVRRFGPAAQIAAVAGSARRLSPFAAAGVLVWSTVTLSGIGLVAVGISGALAAVFNGTLGDRFVGALPQTYSGPVCDHFLSIHPGAGNCSIAAVWENSHDAVALRLVAGIVGLALLGIAASTRRYLGSDRSFRRMHSAALAVTTTVCFAAASAVLLGASLDIALTHGSRGVGWYLSGGVVSVFGTILGAALSWRDLRRLRPWHHVLATA